MGVLFEVKIFTVSPFEGFPSTFSIAPENIQGCFRLMKESAAFFKVTECNLTMVSIIN